jgi:hypothetical protein
MQQLALSRRLSFVPTKPLMSFLLLVVQESLSSQQPVGWSGCHQAKSSSKPLQKQLWSFQKITHQCHGQVGTLESSGLYQKWPSEDQQTACHCHKRTTKSIDCQQGSQPIGVEPVKGRGLVIEYLTVTDGLAYH